MSFVSINTRLFRVRGGRGDVGILLLLYTLLPSPSSRVTFPHESPPKHHTRWTVGVVVAVDTRDPVVPVERSDVCVLLQQLLYTPLLSSSSRVISPYDLVPKRRSYMLMLRSRACFNPHAFLLAFARRHTHSSAVRA